MDDRNRTPQTLRTLMSLLEKAVMFAIHVPSSKFKIIRVAFIPSFWQLFPLVAASQTNVIPPSAVQKEQENVTRQRAIDQSLIAGPVVMKTVTAGAVSGKAGGVAVMAKVNNLSNGIDKTIAGVKILAATLEEGATGFMREGSQFVADSTAGWVVTGTGNALATELGVVGATGVTIGAAIGASALVGAAAGTYVHNNTAMGRAVDNTAFRIAPDSFKEAISGTKQYHPDSYEAKAEEVFEAQRLRREHAFNRRVSENQQKRQAEREHIASERAALDAEYALRNRPASERVDEFPSQERGSSASGFDPRAVTEQLKQISADLTARQQQQQMMIQQQRLLQQQPSGASGYYGSGGIYPRGSTKPPAEPQLPRCHPRDMVGGSGLPRCP